MNNIHTNRHRLEQRNEHITKANAHLHNVLGELAQAEQIKTQRADKLVYYANRYSIKLMELLNNIITLSTTGEDLTTIKKAERARQSIDCKRGKRTRNR